MGLREALGAQKRVWMVPMPLKRLGINNFTLVQRWPADPFAIKVFSLLIIDKDDLDFLLSAKLVWWA